MLMGNHLIEPKIVFCDIVHAQRKAENNHRKKDNVYLQPAL
jgi:hypothetical protein